MEFPIKQGERIESHHSAKDKDLAYQFAARVYKELDRLCRGIVLFGSVTQERPQPAQHAHARHSDTVGDIDVLIVLDDVGFQLTPEVMTGYRVIVENSIRAVSTRIHVTTLQFTTFWEYARSADPVLVNILRHGQALVDTGFFEPMQRLLRQGRIKPTDEAVWAYYLRAPQTLRSSQYHVLQAALDLYWAVIDAAHAALMAAGESPTSPRDAATMLRRVYVEKGLLEERYAQTMEHFYQLSKDIMHRNVGMLAGEHYDAWYAQAKDFVDRMRSFLPQTPE